MISVGLDSSPNTVRRPPSVICHICGRPYGTASIKIHIPQCEKKFEDEQKRLPPSQRRKLPDPPMNAVPDTSSMSAKELDEHNEAAFRTFNDAVLVPCQYCGRTFLPDRLEIHNRSCTEDRPAKRVGQAQPRTRPGSSRAMLASSARNSVNPSRKQRHTIGQPTTDLSTSPQKLPSLTQVARRTISSTQSMRASQTLHTHHDSDLSDEKTWDASNEDHYRDEPVRNVKDDPALDDVEIPQFSEVAIRLLTLSDRFERFQAFVQEELTAMRHEMNDLLLHVTTDSPE